MSSLTVKIFTGSFGVVVSALLLVFLGASADAVLVGLFLLVVGVPLLLLSTRKLMRDADADADADGAS